MVEWLIRMNLHGTKISRKNPAYGRHRVSWHVSIVKLIFFSNQMSGVRCQVSGVKFQVSGVRCQGYAEFLNVTVTSAWVSAKFS